MEKTISEELNSCKGRINRQTHDFILGDQFQDGEELVVMYVCFNCGVEIEGQRIWQH